MRKGGSASLQTGAARYTGCWHLLKKEIALSWELAEIRLVKILLALQADLIPWASDYIYGKSGHQTYVSWHANLCLIVSQEFNYSQIGTSDLLMMYVVTLPPSFSQFLAPSILPIFTQVPTIPPSSPGWSQSEMPHPLSFSHHLHHFHQCTCNTPHAPCHTAM